MPTPLVTHQDPWLWRPDLCPADQDFSDWLKANSITGKRIFHMGPGDHHIIGRLEGNHVTALTCCPSEVESYLRLASEDADIAYRYQVLFGDIHNFDFDCLPRFDIVTLFHLGEAPDERRTPYQRWSIMQILNRIKLKRPNGRVLLYAGSSAFKTIGDLVFTHSSWAYQGQFWSLMEFSVR